VGIVIESVYAWYDLDRVYNYLLEWKYTDQIGEETESEKERISIEENLHCIPLPPVTCRIDGCERGGGEYLFHKFHFNKNANGRPQWQAGVDTQAQCLILKCHNQ
jgi:hypothetical protein